MTFAPIDGAVCILQPGQRPVRLTEESVIGLLEIFAIEGARPLYASLAKAWNALPKEPA